MAPTWMQLCDPIREPFPAEDVPISLELVGVIGESFAPTCVVSFDCDSPGNKVRHNMDNFFGLSGPGCLLPFNIDYAIYAIYCLELQALTAAVTMLAFVSSTFST
jgi:hypothetical protein